MRHLKYARAIFIGYLHGERGTEFFHLGILVEAFLEFLLRNLLRDHALGDFCPHLFDLLKGQFLLKQLANLVYKSILRDCFAPSAKNFVGVCRIHERAVNHFFDIFQVLLDGIISLKGVVPVRDRQIPLFMWIKWSKKLKKQSLGETESLQNIILFDPLLEHLVD